MDSGQKDLSAFPCFGRQGQHDTRIQLENVTRERRERPRFNFDMNWEHLEAD